MLTGVVFGLLPALRATRVDLAGAMKESSRSVTGSRSVLSKGLVVLQVAMSLVLLVGAGLFLRTLDNLKRVDVGFDSKNLLMFSVNPGVNRLRRRPVRAGLTARCSSGCRRCPACVGRPDAHDAPLRQHEHEFDVDRRGRRR